MKTFPTPRYRLGAQANRLVGSSLPPHYIYLDAAAIIALHTSFPIDPTERQDTILKSLGPSTDNVPQIFVTAPLEIMIVDYLKQAHPRKKNGCGVMFGDLPRLGWGQPVVQSYGSMRCEFYLIQPFILEDVSLWHRRSLCQAVADGFSLTSLHSRLRATWMMYRFKTTANSIRTRPMVFICSGWNCESTESSNARNY
jgi:hypothetical protein